MSRMRLFAIALTIATALRFAPVALATPAAFATQSLDFPATSFAPEGLHATVFLPPGYDSGDQRYPVLYLNDGQDSDAVGLAATLARLADDGTIRAPIVIAIDMPKDRMGAYGLSDRRAAVSQVAQTRYGPVGSQAQAYSQWVAMTLVPVVDARYRTRATAEARTMLGWSLGALNAFNLGWQYPELFGRVGAFSPSFWLSAERADADAVQRTRLAQRMVDTGPRRDGARFFFAVGTDEEHDDRDGDGVNDAIDDTRDLVEGWRVGHKLRAKGLRQLGYRIDAGYKAGPSRTDVALFTLDGGQHHQASWARMLPVFLAWAYAPERAAR
jgi:pimeloyl-ACP methyl ester carboxylesterase